MSRIIGNTVGTTLNPNKFGGGKQNTIVLNVPSLAQDATDYTAADKAAVQAAIAAVAESENPVVMLRSGTTLIPSAYYKQSATHYFVGINPDSFPGDGGEVWFTYVKYDTARDKLTVNAHANAGDDGEWLEDIDDLEADFNIPTNNLVFKAIRLALKDNSGGSVTVDTVLDASSTNPVQNRVVTNKLTAMETTVGNIDILLATI